MTKSELFKEAHRLAKQIQADNNIKRYHKALSIALKQLFNHIRKTKSIELDLSSDEIEICRKGFVNIEFFKGLFEIKGAQELANKLQKYAYKVIPYFGGTQLFFNLNVQ